LRTRKGDIIVFTRNVGSKGDLILSGTPVLIVHQTFDHIVIQHNGKKYRLRKIEDRMKVVTAEIAKVLFYDE